MAVEPDAPPFADVIGSADELADLYGPPVEAVVSKIIDHLDGHCRDFIARSPFVLVATADELGNCDVSPKGGAPGFVSVLDEQRLAIPDAPGNRLVQAWLTRDPEVLEPLAAGPKPPKLAIGVEVEEAFLHCAKAFKRSALWLPADWPDRAGLASAAQIWRDHMALDMTTQDVQDFVEDDYENNLTWR